MIAVPVVPIERVVEILKVREEEVGKSIVVVITPGAGERLARIRDQSFVARDARECAVSVVVIEKVNAESIDQNQVEITIVVVVGPTAAVCIPNVVGDGAVGDLRERAVTVIMIEKIS